MKKTCLTLISILFFSLQFIFAQDNQTLPPGKTTIESIEHHKDFPWFDSEYEKYEPQESILTEMRKYPPDFSVVVFAGTWCSDSQVLLPRFYKLTDQVNVSRSDIALYLLDRDKKSPAGLEKEYNITSVPTFIVFKNGKEIGRIVESVGNSVEADLLKIFNQ